MSTFLLFKEALLLFTICPALLKTLSLGTEEPGTQSIDLATSDKIGIEPCLLLHHCKGSPVV